MEEKHQLFSIQLPFGIQHSNIKNTFKKKHIKHLQNLKPFPKLAFLTKQCVVRIFIHTHCWQWPRFLGVGAVADMQQAAPNRTPRQPNRTARRNSLKTPRIICSCRGKLSSWMKNMMTPKRPPNTLVANVCEHSCWQDTRLLLGRSCSCLTSGKAAASNALPHIYHKTGALARRAFGKILDPPKNGQWMGLLQLRPKRNTVHLRKKMDENIWKHTKYTIISYKFT